MTNYIYDGWQVIEERDAADQVKASYIYSGLDEPVAVVKDGTIYYYHYNRLGSIEAVTDAAGGVVEMYSYDPFGGFKIYNEGGAELSESQIGNRYYFTGREYDAETGLYNYRNRYYSPEMGRFMSLDPLGYADSFTAYAYVLSDPVNNSDPYGLIDPTAELEQRLAVCNGQRECDVDVTPRTPQEAAFQNVMNGGFVGIGTATIGAPVVAAYGPTMAAGIGSVGQMLIYQYLQRPETYNQIAKGVITGTLASLGYKTTNSVPSQSDVISYYVSFAIERGYQLIRKIEMDENTSLHLEFDSNIITSTVNNDNSGLHPKK